MQRPTSPESTYESEAEVTASDIRLAKIKKGGKNRKNKKPPIKNKGDQSLSSPASTLPTSSSSIQAADYVPLATDDPYAKLDAFLQKLGLNRDGIPAESLLKLFEQETGPYSRFKWSWFDSRAENFLQGLLLKPSDLNPDHKDSCCARVKPTECSLPIKTTSGLYKVHFARGVIKGAEFSLFKSVHYFIYAMLSWRFVKLIETGELGLGELFSGSDQKGIDSLVQLLAKVQEGWLEFICGGLPVIISLLTGLWSIRQARPITAEEMAAIEQEIKSHLDEPGNIWRDVIREAMLLVSNFISLSAKIQRLELSIRWDGTLSPKERLRRFDIICSVATRGKKITRLNALQSLAKLAQSTGFKDFEKLKEAGFSAESLQSFLKIKATALDILTQVADENNTYADLPARLYARYLLWWLGQSTSILRQSIPFALIKQMKLAIELYFFDGIVTSILEAIHCPDKQGFEVGFGFPQWATELTSDCFTQLFENQFRTVNLSDPVDQLVAQIPLFNLADLTSLEFYYKNLTGNEMVQILTAIDARNSPLIELYIYDYFADADMATLATYLKTSSLEKMSLGCYDNIYSGGEGLSDQGLKYLTEVLPQTQLTFLLICFPNIGNEGIIALANVLNKTKINQFFLGSSNIDDSAGQVLTEAATLIPLTKLRIFGTDVGDGTVRALPYLKSITLLQVQGSSITDQGAQYFAQMIPNTSVGYILIDSPNITDSGVIALVNSLNKLPVLAGQLYLGSSCGEAGMMALAQKLNQTQFWWLTLERNIFTINSMTALVMALQVSTITTLFFTHQQFTLDNMQPLAEGIIFSSISTLSFDHAELDHSVISVLMPSISQLNDFQITSSDLTDEDVMTLAGYLPGSSIQYLYLDYNMIGDVGVIALANILPHTQILELDLSNNNITDLGAKALADIYASTKLQTLYLYNNNISASLFEKIESFQWNKYCQDELCHANAQYNNNPKAVQSQRELSAPRRDSLQRERRSSALTTHRSSFASRDNHAPKKLTSSSSRALVPSSGVFSLPLATSSAERLQPFFISYFLSWSRSLTTHPAMPALPSSSSKVESPLPIQFSSAPNVFTFSSERSPCRYPDGSNNFAAEVWRDAKGLSHFVAPGGLDTSGKAVMPPLAPCELLKPTAELSFAQSGLLAGTTASLIAGVDQAITTILFAMRYRARTTEIAVTSLQFTFMIAFNLGAMTQIGLLLLPLATNKAVTVGARRLLSQGDKIAAPLGLVAGLIVVIVENATPIKLFIWITTFCIAKATRKLMNTATEHLLPARLKPLEPPLLAAKIVSLQRELDRIKAVLKTAKDKNPQQDFTKEEVDLQKYRDELNAIRKDNHAILGTIADLRHNIRQLQYHLTPESKDNSQRFFSHRTSHSQNNSQEPGCFTRVCALCGL